MTRFPEPSEDARDDPVPSGWYATRGRRCLQLALLAAVLPLSVVPALAVALGNLFVFRDPRKVFFTQERVGWRGRVFRIYKFRTMVGSDEDGVPDRRRVTRFGRFLRNSHLDELPQLVNVLRGDMGFIGPRPEMVEIERWAEEQVPGFGRRLAIPPGITGWAQITQGYTARDREAYRRKLEANLEYLERISLGRDLEIILRTVAWMLRGRGWRWSQRAAGAGLTSLRLEAELPRERGARGG